MQVIELTTSACTKEFISILIANLCMSGKESHPNSVVLILAATFVDDSAVFGQIYCSVILSWDGRSVCSVDFCGALQDHEVFVL